MTNEPDESHLTEVEQQSMRRALFKSSRRVRSIPTDDTYDGAKFISSFEENISENLPTPVGWLVDEGFMLTDPKDKYAIPLFADPRDIDLKKRGSVTPEEVEARARDLIDWNGETMKAWDSIRECFSEGDDGGSLPRDIFESLMSDIYEVMMSAIGDLTIARSRCEVLEKELDEVRELSETARTDGFDMAKEEYRGLLAEEEGKNEKLRTLAREAHRYAYMAAWGPINEKEDREIKKAEEALWLEFTEGR